MRPHLLCTIGFLFVKLPFESQAQGTCVSGYLVEASSQAPLRFAAVQLQRDGAGAVADEHGYFELESAAAWDRDSLLVFTRLRGLSPTIRSAHGVAHDHSQGLRLSVAGPPVAPTPAPAPRAAPLRRKRAFPAAPTLSPAATRATWGTLGTQYAFFVQNENPARRVTLRTASFYIGEDGFPREVFRVRLYQADGGRPGAELLPDERVFLWALRSNAWYTVTVAPYRLVLPAAGYFVALEYIPDEGHISAYTRAMLEDHTPTGPFTRPAYAAHASTIWSHAAGTAGWTLLPLDNGQFGRYAAMIKLEVDPLKE